MFKLNRAILTGLALIAPWAVFAIELPTPATLMAEYALESHDVIVIEPHESTKDRSVTVSFRALPMNNLLTKWFGDSWKLPGAEIVVFAQDGYRTVVMGDNLKKYRSHLAFARTDGSPFVVDNVGLNQKNIPLAPYYLIWENQGIQDLIRQGAYGWPYQIKTIELRSQAENQVLLPHKNNRHLEEGLSETKTYCLSCHQIRGVGGKKYAGDLLQATCQWPKADLKAMIESPSRFNPNTTMPAIGRMLPAIARQRILGHIMAYLTAMETELPVPCIKKKTSDVSVKPISECLLD